MLPHADKFIQTQNRVSHIKIIIFMACVEPKSRLSSVLKKLESEESRDEQIKIKISSHHTHINSTQSTIARGYSIELAMFK